jgi:dienelactone hydrolase
VKVDSRSKSLAIHPRQDFSRTAKTERKMSCSECFAGAVDANADTPLRGTMEVIHGRRCYVSLPPTPTPASTDQTTCTSTGASSPNTTIIYLTDAFGLNLPNAPHLADRLSLQTGFRVLVPDLIPFGGARPSVMAARDRADGLAKTAAWWDLPSQIKKVALNLFTLFFTTRFVLWSSPKVAYRWRIVPFVKSVREELVKSEGTMKGKARLAVIGFCWGGYGSTRLCTEAFGPDGKQRLVDVQVCGHPFALTTPRMVVEAVTKFSVPYLMLIGDQDGWLKIEDVERTKKALEEVVDQEREGATETGESGRRAYVGEIKVYPGCTHGFVVRAKPGNEVETSAAEDARVMAIDWLKNYLSHDP